LAKPEPRVVSRFENKAKPPSKLAGKAVRRSSPRQEPGWLVKGEARQGAIGLNAFPHVPKSARDEMVQRKNAAVLAERELQKDLRNRRAEEERAAREQEEAKRRALIEKRRQQEEERKSRMRRLQEDEKARKRRLENLEAPFKKANPKSRPSSGLSSPDDAAAASVEPEIVEEPVKMKVLRPQMKVTSRPGRALEVHAEIENLRAEIARRRAEMRRQAIEKGKHDQPVSKPAEKTKGQPELIPVKLEDEQTVDLGPDEVPVKEELKGLDDLIGLDWEPEDDGENDLIGLVAIAKNIFDHPPSTSSDEEEMREIIDEEEAKDETPIEPKRTASDAKFFMDGKELKLPSVTDRDSMNYRIEALRKFIEDGIGVERFVRAYRFLGGGSDGLSEQAVDIEVRQIFCGEKQLAYYPLVHQLVVCEESLADL
jgi:hypothetical protein